MLFMLYYRFVSYYLLMIISVCCVAVNYGPPEVINNNNNDPSTFGYEYPIPEPGPGFFEEPINPKPPTNLYIPSVTYEPPQFDPTPAPHHQYLPPAPISKFHVTNLSCMDSPFNGYFNAIINAPNPNGIVVDGDNVPPDCINHHNNIVYNLNLNGERMKKCGVRFCANGLNMCLNLRAPTIRGLKLSEDFVTTLQCRPQERVVARTQHFKFHTNNRQIQGRSIGTITTGGTQRNFDTHVSLFRKGNTGDYTREVNLGSVVELGEELLLRASVRDGDGWKYSRLGDVSIQHDTIDQQSIQLVDASGCRDIRMRSICPENPIQTTPLTTTLPLRAFMFQNMHNGDEMIITVKMIACIHYEDCYNKDHNCDQSVRASRLRRHIDQQSIIRNTNNATTKNWQSFLEFRVAQTTNNHSHFNIIPAFILSTIVLIVVLLGVLFCLCYACM